MPGMKLLKAVQVEGETMKVRRYKPLTSIGDTEYDAESKGLEQSGFDKFSLKMVLNDYMYTDPATRYQIARNYFERALNDAKVCLFCLFV